MRARGVERAAGLPLLALGACAHAPAPARPVAVPAAVSAFTADFDSARVIAIGLQGRVERHPDRLMVVVERAQLPPLADDETMRAALARPGARDWVIAAASAPLGRDWFQHGGEQAWTPIRFVVPLGAGQAVGDDDLVFVFERGVGQRGGAFRRVVPAVVRPLAPAPAPDTGAIRSARLGT